jgi:hypothetical protein
MAQAHRTLEAIRAGNTLVDDYIRLRGTAHVTGNAAKRHEAVTIRLFSLALVPIYWNQLHYFLRLHKTCERLRYFSSHDVFPF